MEKDYKKYSDLIKEELIVTMSCTEPIAIVYAGAIAGEKLDVIPDKFQIKISGNIIKIMVDN